MAGPERRDPIFLDLAFLAGIGGVAALAASIGMPLWTYYHGGGWNPSFFFFGLWGIAALCGCAANVYVYFQSGPPKGPPKGGKRLAEVMPLDARRTAPEQAPLTERERKAA